MHVSAISHITHCESCISDIPTDSSREKCENEVALFNSDFHHPPSAPSSPFHHPPQPNYTLASRVEGKSKSKGQPVSVRGFWSDIVCGPFAAFALEADEPRLFEARGGFSGRSDDATVEASIASIFSIIVYFSKLTTIFFEPSIIEENINRIRLTQPPYLF